MRIICKITWTDGQCRITIPKILVKEASFENAEFVVMEKQSDQSIKIRRVIDDQTFKTKID